MTALGAYGDFRERILQADSARVLDRIADHVHASALPGPQRTELYDLITERRKAFPADSPTPKGDAQNPPPFSAPRPTSSPSPGTAGRPEDSSMEEDAELQRKMAGTQRVFGDIRKGEIDRAVEKVKADSAPPSEIVVAPQAEPSAGLVTKAMADAAIESYRQFERVKSDILVEKRHFVTIQGHPHIKREGAIVLAAMFRVSTLPPTWELEYDDGGDLRKATATLKATWAGREVTMTGTCERRELQGDKTDHNVRAKAETRAFKRAVLAVLGSADPTTEEDEE